jgi:predicted small lipoprotein YifL
MWQRTSFIRLALRGMAVATTLAALAGCGAIGAVAYKAIPPSTPPAYKPVKDDMLVLVENFRNPSSVSLTSERLDRQIAYELVEHKVAPIINPDRLEELRLTKQKQYSSMNVAAIGKAMGARQVLYADLIDFSVETAMGSEMSKGHAELRVRVIDVATGQTRWPEDVAAGYPVKLETPFLPLKSGVTESTLRDQMIHTLADRTAQVFYGHFTDEEMEAPVAPVGD